MFFFAFDIIITIINVFYLDVFLIFQLFSNST